jgi:plastocyanin
VKKIILLSALVILAVVISGCTQSQPATGNTGNNDNGAGCSVGSASASCGTTTPKTFTVSITSSGFSPQSLAINAGDTVNFVNNDSATHWPASDVHPTHGAYPEPGGCLGSKFDACKGLAQGETFSFVFNQKGNWAYHDHLHPALTGTITVK